MELELDLHFGFETAFGACRFCGESSWLDPPGRGRAAKSPYEDAGFVAGDTHLLGRGRGGPACTALILSDASQSGYGHTLVSLILQNNPKSSPKTFPEYPLQFELMH